MESLKAPNSNFDFQTIKLLPPISLNNGNHFIKIMQNGEKFYIQPPKCSLKQGIIKSSKRMYCDLMFTNENSEFIEWLENLEIYCRTYIYNNRNDWFETELDENDIENSFTSPIKIFKSGKFFLLRVNIASPLGKPSLKIYDEYENSVEVDNIKDDDLVISALEVQGIKCSPRSFQIEIELKQLLIMNKTDIFQNCVLLKKDIQPEIPTVNKEECQIDEVKESEPDEVREPEVDEVNDEIEKLGKEETEKTEEKVEKSDTMEEFDISLDELKGEPISLKKRNDIYYEMYKEALQKAKMAKQMALTSFLEAKKIKNTYMLDDIEDDDSDLEENDDENDE